MEMLSLVKDNIGNEELCRFVGEKMKKAGIAQVTLHKVVNKKGKGQVEYLLTPENSY
ncbi:MAG: hypothetical protein J6O49_00450 [Bacteroidaceae bacterium]|nr:hypothetical protein [Bacteroidaceae bacterium]